MTVKELINELKKIPDDYYVNAFDNNKSKNFDVLSVVPDHGIKVVFIDIED
jgi:hypothetical protein